MATEIKKYYGKVFSCINIILSLYFSKSISETNLINLSILSIGKMLLPILFSLQFFSFLSLFIILITFCLISFGKDRYLVSFK